MDPISILQNLYSVAMVIYNQVEQTHANKAQCKRLGTRITTLMSALKGLETQNKIPKNSEHFITALLELREVMNDILNHIKSYNKNHWMIKLLKAGIDVGTFDDLNTRLEQAITHLNVGLNVQQIMNREQDKADVSQDLQDINSKQDEIIRLNQEQKTQLQQLTDAHQDQSAILAKQLASMKVQLSQLLQPLHQRTKPPLESHLLVPFFDLQFVHVINHGSFGVVYEGLWNNQKVAIKTLEGNVTESQHQQFIREVQIISRLRSRQITQFYAACLESGRYALVMEYMEKGNLHNALTKSHWTLAERHQLTIEVVQGLAYLHQKDIIHRDLRSTNILLDADNHAKLADFGLSKTEFATVIDIQTGSKAMAWMAPEVMSKKSTSTASDIYSLGVVIWEIMTGKTPWANLTETNIYQNVTQGQREVIPDTIPTDYAKLIQDCWNAKPEHRPTAADVLQRLQMMILRPTSPDGETLCRQGMEYERNGKLAEAFPLYRRSAEKGYMRGHTNVGNFYLQGLGGVTVDTQKAKASFEEAAKQGHVRAMFNLATLHESGKGIPVNLRQALQWYEAAAQAGDEESKNHVNRVKKLIDQQPTLKPTQASKTPVMH